MSYYLDVMQQGRCVLDASRHTVLVGRQRLQLPQQAPHPLQLKGSQVNFNPRFDEGRGGLLIIFVIFLFVVAVKVFTVFARGLSLQA